MTIEDTDTVEGNMYARMYRYGSFLAIRKTCPSNVYSCKPHFYIEKLGFAGVYLIFLFLIQNIHCGYSLVHNVCFEQNY